MAENTRMHFPFHVSSKPMGARTNQLLMLIKNIYTTPPAAFTETLYLEFVFSHSIKNLI